jgi:hypothetical protein
VRGYLLDEVVLKLTAFDSRREPHLIYEGSTDMARCGEIKKSSADNFFFA